MTNGSGQESAPAKAAAKKPTATKATKTAA
jgi:hypothetical protein